MKFNRLDLFLILMAVGSVVFFIWACGHSISNSREILRSLNTADDQPKQVEQEKEEFQFVQPEEDMRDVTYKHYCSTNAHIGSKDEPLEFPLTIIVYCQAERKDLHFSIIKKRAGYLPNPYLNLKLGDFIEHDCHGEVIYHPNPESHELFRVVFDPNLEDTTNIGGWFDVDMRCSMNISDDAFYIRILGDDGRVELE